MPQPVRENRVHWDTDYTKLATEAPTLAAHLMVITNLWNLLEDNMTGLLVSMLTRHELIGSNLIRGMFDSVISADGRREMMRSVASLRLSRSDQTIIEGLLKEMRKLAGERADYVHGFWAVCTIPNAIVRVPRPAEYKSGKPIPKLFVYKERDFLATEERLKSLNGRVLSFSFNLVGQRTKRR